MNNLTTRVYFKTLFSTSMLLIILSILQAIIYRYEIDSVIIKAATIWVVLFVPYHSWLLLFSWKQCKQSFKLSIFTGFLSGVILVLVVRMVLAIYYLLWWRSGSKIETLNSIFCDFWQIYLWIGLWGSICMAIDPFFRIVFHKDLFRNSKQSSFWTKYSPSALIEKYIFRKD